MSVSGDLDARVARLEREARIWRAAAVLSILVAAVTWVVPSVSAQTQPPNVLAQNVVADSILARQIIVVPNPGPGDTHGAVASIGLVAKANAASVLVYGPTAEVTVQGPGGAGPGSTGPTLRATANGQYAAVSTSDTSQNLAPMGFVQGLPGAFRAFDMTVSQTEPVWTAP
jgi:hypothetical protein